MCSSGVVFLLQHNIRAMATMRAVYVPAFVGRKHAIFLEGDTRQYEVTEEDLNHLPRFYGGMDEDVLDFLRSFDYAVSDIPHRGLDDCKLRRRLFPFTLIGGAKRWLAECEPDSLKTWKEVMAEFMNEYLPYHKLVELKKEITEFTQA